MKNVQNYTADKYSDDKLYEKIEDGVYFCYDAYVTSLSFEQEPDLGESDSPASISQYPVEDLLDKFLVAVDDFYVDLNKSSKTTCYLEFASPDVEGIKGIRSIIGKHVYNDKDNNLIIE